MYKKLILSFIFTLSSLSIFAQNESNLHFTGEIYENTCDITSLSNDAKCEMLNKAQSINQMIINDKTISPENIKTHIKNFEEIHSTFYAANLKSIKNIQATNLEISYK